jgi:hypothetical protein
MQVHGDRPASAAPHGASHRGPIRLGHTAVSWFPNAYGSEKTKARNRLRTPPICPQPYAATQSLLRAPTKGRSSKSRWGEASTMATHYAREVSSTLSARCAARVRQFRLPPQHCPDHVWPAPDHAPRAVDGAPNLESGRTECASARFGFQAECSGSRQRLPVTDGGPGLNLAGIPGSKSQTQERRAIRLQRGTAPVSHQKRPERNATKAIGHERKRRKINETDRYPVAHNGLAAGSTQAELATKSMAGHSLLVTAPQSRSQYLPGAKSWMYRSLAASTSAGEAIPDSIAFSSPQHPIATTSS